MCNKEIISYCLHTIYQPFQPTFHTVAGCIKVTETMTIVSLSKINIKLLQTYYSLHVTTNHEQKVQTRI